MRGTQMSEIKVGRPRKYDNPDDFLKDIEFYLNNTPRDELSVTGLALVIGSKQLLSDYEKREEFKDIITEAKLIVENSYELSLRKHGRTGDIFALKNFGWSDKTEQDVNQRYVNKEGEDLTTEDLKILADYEKRIKGVTKSSNE